LLEQVTCRMWMNCKPMPVLLQGLWQWINELTIDSNKPKMLKIVLCFWPKLMNHTSWRV